MNFQIRDAITTNVHGQSAAEFKDIVEDAISRGEEHLLPGLGVFLKNGGSNLVQLSRMHLFKNLKKPLLTNFYRQFIPFPINA